MSLAENPNALQIAGTTFTLPILLPFNVEILQNFQKLNTSGKKEAAKRVQELTEIPRYTIKEEPPAE